MTASNDLVTLPVLCAQYGFSIDSAREVVRAHRELRELGVRVGGVRAFRPHEVEQVVGVLRARRERREKVVVATT